MAPGLAAAAAAANSAAPGPCILAASSRAATGGLWSGARVTLGIAADLRRLDAACIAFATAAILLGGALPVLAACVFAARALRIGQQLAGHITRLCGGALLVFAGLAVVAGP